MTAPTAPLALAIAGVIAVILGLYLNIHLLWVAGVVALVIAAGLFLYAAFKPRNRRTRR